MFGTHLYHRARSAGIWPAASIIFILTDSYFHTRNDLKMLNTEEGKMCRRFSCQHWPRFVKSKRSTASPEENTGSLRFRTGMWEVDPLKMGSFPKVSETFHMENDGTAWHRWLLTTTHRCCVTRCRERHVAQIYLQFPQTSLIHQDPTCIQQPITVSSLSLQTLLTKPTNKN